MARLILAVIAFVLLISGRLLGRWVDGEIGQGRPRNTTPPGYARSQEQAEKEALLWKAYSERLPILKKLKKLAFWTQITAAFPALIAATAQFFNFL